MTLEDLNIKLNSLLGFNGKVVYRSFPEGAAPALPFICFYSNGSDNVSADNKAYLKRDEVTIELYSAKKDLTSESLIEAMLDTEEIFYDKVEDYIEEEHCYMISYEITI